MESVLSAISKADKREIIAKDIQLPDVFINGSTHIMKREGKKFYLHFSYLPEDSKKEYFNKMISISHDKEIKILKINDLVCKIYEYGVDTKSDKCKTILI